MKGLRKSLLIGMTLGVTMLGTIGCMNQDSASSNQRKTILVGPLYDLV